MSGQVEQANINLSGILPTGGHLLVIADRVEEVTAGGIIIPQDTREREQVAGTVGTLIAVGASSWKDLDDGKPWAKVGDKISYARHAGFGMVGQDGEDYLLINDNDVLAKLLF